MVGFFLFAESLGYTSLSAPFELDAFRQAMSAWPRARRTQGANVLASAVIAIADKRQDTQSLRAIVVPRQSDEAESPK